MGVAGGSPLSFWFVVRPPRAAAQLGALLMGRLLMFERVKIKRVAVPPGGSLHTRPPPPNRTHVPQRVLSGQPWPNWLKECTVTSVQSCRSSARSRVVTTELMTAALSGLVGALAKVP